MRGDFETNRLKNEQPKGCSFSFKIFLRFLI